MNINWHNIRSINGDQKEGFEELIVQLARKEKIPNQKKFIRKGKPDAGVECFWIMNDNTEWAWQAKFFTSSLGDSQWSLNLPHKLVKQNSYFHLKFFSCK